MAASVQSAAISAPTNPCVSLAMASGSTSSSSFMLRVWMRKISNRPKENKNTSSEHTTTPHNIHLGGNVAKTLQKIAKRVSYSKHSTRVEHRLKTHTPRRIYSHRIVSQHIKLHQTTTNPESHHIASHRVTSLEPNSYTAPSRCIEQQSRESCVREGKSWSTRLTVLVRYADVNLAIESSETPQGGIHGVRSVRRSNNNHLGKHIVGHVLEKRA